MFRRCWSWRWGLAVEPWLGRDGIGYVFDTALVLPLLADPEPVAARVMAALSEHHRLTAHDRLGWDLLKDELFVLPRSDAGADLQDIVTARLSDPGWRPHVEIQSVSQETILNDLSAAYFITLAYERCSRATIPRSRCARSPTPTDPAASNSRDTGENARHLPCLKLSSRICAARL